MKPLSYSEYSSYLWNREKYYLKYVLGEEEEPNKEMILGKLIHKAIEHPSFPIIKELKEKGFERKTCVVVRKLLNKIELFGEREKDYRAKLVPFKEEISRHKIMEEIPLYAVFDEVDLENGVLLDDKTTENPERYNQYKVDYHEQLSFYALMYNLNRHAYFRDIQLRVLDTTKGKVTVYHTVRSARDIAFIRDKVMRVISLIKQEGWWDRRIDRKKRIEGKNMKLLQ